MLRVILYKYIILVTSAQVKLDFYFDVMEMQILK